MRRLLLEGLALLVFPVVFMACLLAAVVMMTADWVEEAIDGAKRKRN